MKIYRNLFDIIISPENLFSAWDAFKSDKRNKQDVQRFEWNLEQNIFELRRDLKNKTYKHGSYEGFYIRDPKQRHIHKALVRDRILHHAVSSVLSPIFEPTFISTSFSCRIGFGTHKGVFIDAGILQEIRTYGQRFSNNPNEKFLLMILGSQAKLENDNRGINVKRGLRTRVEMGLWPGVAPVGYLNQKHMEKKCQVIIDSNRAPIVKKIFEKMAYEKWSGRKIYHWLKFELNFKTIGNHNMALSNIYRTLQSPFYYGTFEYPKNSGNWYKGKHEPIVDKELFDKVQENN